MPAPKGRPKPAGSGKKKGQKIKKTLQWEEFGKIVIEGNLPRVQAHLASLEGQELYEAWLKLINYFKPQLARTETKGDTTMTLTIKRVTDDN